MTTCTYCAKRDHEFRHLKDSNTGAWQFRNERGHWAGCPTMETRPSKKFTRIPFSSVMGAGFMEEPKKFLLVAIPNRGTKDETERLADVIERALVADGWVKL